MKQELSFEQKCRQYDKVKGQNFIESSRLEGIEYDAQSLPVTAEERSLFKAALIARYTQKVSVIEES